MAWKKQHVPYMTQNDRERIDKIDQNPFTISRKCKYMMTLGKKGLDQKICIYVYGKDEAEVKANAKNRLAFYQNTDKNWKMTKLENCYIERETSNESQQT